MTQLLPPPNEREPGPLNTWDLEERARYLLERGWEPVERPDGQRWKHSDPKTAGCVFVLEAAWDIEQEFQAREARRR